MLGMGITLNISDFKEVIMNPKEVLVGVSIQFLFMPLLGFTSAELFKMPPELAAGMVLVGSCPGGTASNVLVYLSKGNVPLSITMTSVSTLLAPLLTPLLMLFYANKWLEINPLDLFFSIIQIIIFPIALGIFIRSKFSTIAEEASKYTPSISVIAILLIIACIVSLNTAEIIRCPTFIILAVLIHNLMGLGLGYNIPKLANISNSSCRAISFETGVQNAGLGAALAIAHYSPLTALPSVIFAVTSLITSSVLTNHWRKH